MSFVNLFGGVEKAEIDQIKATLNELEKQIQLLDQSFTEKNNADADKIEALELRMTRNKMDIKKDIENAFDRISALEQRYAQDSICKRLDEMERMLNYLRSSHGKALNDIQDLKHELYGLYGRQTPPPKVIKKDEPLRVLPKDDQPEKISNKEPKESCELIQLMHHYGFTGRKTALLVRFFKEYQLSTLNDLHKIARNDLAGLKFVGPVNIDILLKIYDTGLNGAKTDYTKFDLRSVIFDIPAIETSEKAYLYDRLIKNNIPNFNVLAHLPFEYVIKTCNFGTRAQRNLRTVYKKYIWAEGE